MIKKGLCFILSLLFFLVGCHGKSKKDCYEFFKQIQRQMEIPSCAIYRYHPDQSQNRILSRLYGSEESIMPPAIAFCDDFLLCLYEGDDIWELHVFRTISIYDNKRIQEMLISRRDMLQNGESWGYYSELTQNRVLTAEVFSYQNFVILAVTDRNEDVHTILKSMK